MPRPDDGLIHAWLDGQLSPDEAARVEQLVARDAAWAAAAADARGVIAATSRILSSLDDVPAGVVPKGMSRPAKPAARRLPWWTKAAATVVLVVGASTLVLRRTPDAEIVPIPPASDAVSTAVSPSVPETAPVAPAATTALVLSKEQTQPKMAAKFTSKVLADAPSASGGRNLASAVVLPPATAPATAPAPERLAELATDRALASVPANTAQSRPLGALSGVRAQSIAPPDQSARTQQSDQVRQNELQVSAQRTSSDRRREAAPAAEPLAAPAPAQTAAAEKSVLGFAAPAPAAVFRALVGACYSLQQSGKSVGVGGIMRGERIAGDTLFLVPVSTPSPARAWVASHDGVAHGVLTTETEARSMVLVTASPVACPVP